MVRTDYFDDPNNIHEYYHSMYLDGFEPWQIYEAMRKKQMRMVKEMRQNPPQPQESEEYTVNITSTVEDKK